MGLDPITTAIQGISTAADLAKNIIDRIWPKKMDDSEKAVATLEIEKVISSRDTTVMAVQRDIMVAELAQGDTFTKRARPMVVYMGLFFIFLVHVALPILAWITLTVKGSPLTNMPNLTLPTDFWWAWGGICTTWVIGRTFEKNGSSGGIVQAIMGGK